MSTLLKNYDTQLDAVLAVAEQTSNDGPAWLQVLRKNGLRTFMEHGVPTPKNEEWKYTALRAFAERNWVVARSGPAVFNEEPISYEAESIKVVLVNGRFDRNLSLGSDANLPSGLSITSLLDAIAQNDPLLPLFLAQLGSITTKTFDREIRPDIYPFASLNLCLFEDGVVIRIAKDTKIESLIEIVHVSSSEEQPHSLSVPRILIVAESGSTAKITESYISDQGDTSAVIAVTEVAVGEGANIEHIRLQDQSKSSTHIGVWQTRQEKNSTYTAYNVAYGAQLARLDQCIWIGGEGCTTRLDGVVCANGDQHLDNHTRLDHAVPNCNSFEIYKQVIDDHATVVFNGKIFVHEDAQKTDAKQTNQALLLSPKATIDSKPQLEIFADDVKCTHGATVGQLEDLPMFYMRSRGVPRDEAEAVLVYAFAAEVLEMMSLDSVRTSLERKLYQKLGVDLS